MRFAFSLSVTSFILAAALLFAIQPAFANCNTFSVNYTNNASLGSGTQTSSPSVFTYGGNLYMLVGHLDGRLTGWTFNGSQWLNSSAINSSLIDVGSSSAPEVFTYAGNLSLLVGNSAGAYFAYTYDGANWVNNYTLNASLPVGLTNPFPSVFTYAGNLSLLVGSNAGTYFAYTYDGANWVANYTLNASLPDAGADTVPEIFTYGGNLYMLSGTQLGNLAEFIFNGSQWLPSSSFNSTIGDVGASSAPSVFTYGGNLNMLVGTTTLFGLGYSNITLPLSSTYSSVAANVSYLPSSSGLRFGAIVSSNCASSAAFIQHNSSGSFALASSAAASTPGTLTTFPFTYNLSLTDSFSCNRVVGFRICNNDTAGTVNCSSAIAVSIMPYIVSSTNPGVSVAAASCGNSTHIAFRQNGTAASNYTVYMPKQTAYGNVTCPYSMTGQYSQNITNNTEFCRLSGRGRSISSSTNVTIDISSAISGARPSSIPTAVATVVTLGVATVVVTTYIRRRRRSSYASAESSPSG